MRVLLLKVPSYSDVVAPPLGIGYLAETIKDKVELFVYDGIKEKITVQKWKKIIYALSPDIIGLSVVSASADNAILYAREAKLVDPSAITVAGGPHPTAMPEEFLTASFGAFDLILAGEAEKSFCNLIEAVASEGGLPSVSDLKKINGVVFRAENEIVSTPVSWVKNIDELGMPAWEFIPPDEYPKIPHGAFFREFPIAPVITSRGCPFHCRFCATPLLTGGLFRMRSPELIVDELKLLKKKYHIREFQIVDDNFTLNPEHTIAVCEAIIKAGIKMPWSLPNGVRIEGLTGDVLRAMKDSGCYSFAIGIESGSSRVLKAMKKRLELNDAVSTVERAAKMGFEVNGFFMLGYPGETRKEFSKTIELAKKLPISRANFSLFTPLPGTPIYGDLRSLDELPSRRDMTFADVSFTPRDISKRELKMWQRYAILSFYMRPRQMFDLALAMQSPERAFYVLKRASRWLGNK